MGVGLKNTGLNYVFSQWVNTMKAPQKMPQKAKTIEVQAYFPGCEPPAPKKRQSPAKPVTSPKPTTTKKGSVRNVRTNNAGRGFGVGEF